MHSARLFTALWPGPHARQALAACRDALPWPAGTVPTPADKLHLTLHFIGSVPLDRLPEVAAGLQLPMQGFDLRLSIIDSWRGGVTVLRPDAVPQALQQLHSEQADALQRLGLPVEHRPYRPHVTLARHGPGLPAETALPAAAPLHWRVSGHVLVRSTGDGRYQVLQRCGRAGVIASPRGGQ